MGITENASYIKGLAEGLELDSSTKEGKVILKLIDLVSDLAEKVSVLENENSELYDYMEQMAEDIIDLEDLVYGDEESEDFEDYSDLNDDDDDFVFDEDDEYYATPGSVTTTKPRWTPTANTWPQPSASMNQQSLFRSSPVHWESKQG